MTITTGVYANDNAAGGWTDPETIARRICSELWKATGAFERIKDYHADVIIDYGVILRNIETMTPGRSIRFSYVVGRNGTHLFQGADVDLVLADDRGGDTGRFIFTISRALGQTDKVTGAEYGTDRYALIISSVDAD